MTAEYGNGKPHFVPLPRQAVAVLQDLEKLTRRPDGLVFRGERNHDRPMNDSTLNAALRALGFAADKVTGHLAEDRRLCLDAGMNGHLGKPLEMDELWTALLYWVAHSRAMKAPTTANGHHADRNLPR